MHWNKYSNKFSLNNDIDNKIQLFRSNYHIFLDQVIIGMINLCLATAVGTASNKVAVLVSIFICYISYYWLSNYELIKMIQCGAIDEYEAPIRDKVIFGIYSVFILAFAPNMRYSLMTYLLFITISGFILLIKEFKIEKSLKPFKSRLLSSESIDLMFKSKKVMNADLTKSHVEYKNSIVSVYCGKDTYRFVLVPSTIRNRKNTYVTKIIIGDKEIDYTRISEYI